MGFVINRIEVSVKRDLSDAQGAIDAQRILNALGLDVEVEYRKIYSEDLGLNSEELEKLSKELGHPVINDIAIGNNRADEFDHVIEVGYKPGVMDPEGRSAKLLAEDILGRKFPFERRIAVQHQRLIKGKLTDVQLRKIAGLFANDTVQNFKIWDYNGWKNGIEPYVPTVKVPAPEPIKHYDLGKRFDEERFIEEAMAHAKPDEMEKVVEEAKKKIESWKETAKNYYKGELNEDELLTATELLHISDSRTLALDLPEMKTRRMSPTLVQRDFERVIRQIGTPAQPPKPRGNSPGRSKGTRLPSRPRQKVVIKGQKQANSP